MAFNSGTALELFKSYLCGKQQVVIIADKCAVPKPLSYGVPQGSVLGPKTYCAYTKPLGIISKHKKCFHLYADDTQLCIALKPGAVEESMKQFEAYISRVNVDIQ